MGKHTFKPAPDFEQSCLQGEIDISYAEVKKVFGKPHSNGDGYKVDAEWMVKFDDGTYATIYNYKTGRNYNGAKAPATSKIRDWHIGGSSSNAVLRVKEALGLL